MRTETRKTRLYIYFPPEAIDEVDAMAERLQRSRSWVLLHAWRLARPQLEALPALPQIPKR